MSNEHDERPTETSTESPKEEPYDEPPVPTAQPLPTDILLLKLRDVVKEEFIVNYAYIDARDNLPIFVIEEDEYIKERSMRLTDRLQPHNMLAVIRRVELFEGTGERSTVIKLVPAPPTRKRRSYLINVVLFIATLIAVLWAGWTFAASPGMLYIYANFKHLPYDPILAMILYTVAILSIIGLHEFGHVLASRLHKIEASLPYFIPGIYYGTFGALIVQRSPPPTRDSLFDLGITGPVVGFIVSLIAVIFGLMLNPIITHAQYLELIAWLEAQNLGVTPLYDPLLIQIISSIMFIGVPSDSHLVAHPLYIAGWVGFLITGLNYFPIGQLDGGHVARSLFGQKYHQIASLVSVIILFLIGYVFMALIAFFLFYGRHPGPVDDVSPLSTGRKIIGVLSLFLPLLLLPPGFYL